MTSLIYCFHLQALIFLTNGNETPKLPPAGPRGARVPERARARRAGGWGATCLLAAPQTPPPAGAPAGFEPPGCLVKFMGVPSPPSLHPTVSRQMRFHNVQQLGEPGAAPPPALLGPPVTSAPVTLPSSVQKAMPREGTCFLR